jgi:hypothetical protein
MEPYAAAALQGFGGEGLWAPGFVPIVQSARVSQTAPRAANPGDAPDARHNMCPAVPPSFVPFHILFFFTYYSPAPQTAPRPGA